MTTIFELVKPPSPCRIPRALPMRSFAVILLLFFLCSAVLCAGWLVGWVIRRLGFPCCGALCMGQLLFIVNGLANQI